MSDQDTSASPGNPSSATPQQSEPNEVEESGYLYGTLIAIGIAFAFALGAFSAFDWNGLLFKFGEVEFNMGPGVLLIDLAFVTASLVNGYVGAKSIAGAYFAGKALKNLDSGLHFATIGLMNLNRQPKGIQERQEPDDNPDNVFHGEDLAELPKGMTRPIRIVTGAPKAAAKPVTKWRGDEDTLETRMTIDTSFATQWQITGVIDFVANYGSEKQFLQQLRDVGEATLSEEFAMRSVSEVVSQQQAINTILYGRVQQRFPHSGIKIISVRLISPNLGHRVSSALADIAEARSKATAAITTAEAARVTAIKAGEGEGGKDKARFTGRAAGLKAIKDKLGVGGDAILAAETSRDIAEKLPKEGTFVLGASNGIADIVGVSKVVQAALNK